MLKTCKSPTIASVLQTKGSSFLRTARFSTGETIDEIDKFLANSDPVLSFELITGRSESAIGVTSQFLLAQPGRFLGPDMNSSFKRLVFLFGLNLCIATALPAQTPRAVYTDPPHDSVHPARVEVLHIPSGGVKINGLAYIAEGAGTHPTVILCHGLPGNEKNLDLAQAIRRAGWNVVTFNYRGSWGSPGEFRFANNPEDAEAVLAFIRDTANARRLAVDAHRIVMGGHSMGGWVTALTASRHPELRGAFLISAADMGSKYSVPRDKLTGFMADDMESLAGVTAQSMAEEIISKGSGWMFGGANTQGFAHMPLVILTADDNLAPDVQPLISQMRSLGNKRVVIVHRATDHSWSDSRIALESTIIRWLQTLTASSG